MKNIKWTGKAGDSAWGTGSNWKGGVPGAGANVLFSDGGSWTLDMTGAEPQLGAMIVEGDQLIIPDTRIDLDAPPPKHGAAVDFVIERNGSVTLGEDAILAATNLVQVGGFAGGTLSAGSLNVGDYSGGWSSGIEVYDGVFALSGPGVGWDVESLFAQVGGPGNTALTVSKGAAMTGDASAFVDLLVGNGGTGAGQVLVTDPGSALSFYVIDLGNGYNGTLTVRNQGLVTAQAIEAGRNGDGFLNVTSGGTVAATGGITIGDAENPPVGSVMEITNHGSVYSGTYGLLLEEGTLKLDPTAVLFGAVTSIAGKIDALAAPGKHAGTVTFGQGVGFGDVFGMQYGNISTVFSQGGATLDFAGEVSTGETDTIVQVASGHVELSNGANLIGHLALAGGTLTIAASGAAGGGTLSFLNAYGQQSGAARLEIDKGVKPGATITGIGNGDTIDLKGFAFGAGVTDSYANGTLTLNNGSASTTLLVQGTYTAAEFTFGTDAGGGTLIHFHHG